VTLQAFTRDVAAFRDASRRRLMDPGAYPRLPESQFASRDAGWRREWRHRAGDLALVLSLLERKGTRTVLDVGAWNGWLSNRLALQGLQVTAVDYFDDRYDGLGARVFYETDWDAIQMDLLDLSLLDSQFDAIVINRCLQFFPDPAAFVRHATGRLAPGGQLIATGLQIYRNPVRKRRSVAALRDAVRQRFGFELFLRPTKGYLDSDDERELTMSGMRLLPHPGSRLRNLAAATMVPTRPRHLYGLLDAAQR
jgi:SAM-dependent methyltransferase